LTKQHRCSWIETKSKNPEREEMKKKTIDQTPKEEESLIILGFTFPDFVLCSLRDARNPLATAVVFCQNKNFT
jgi:hypothetical protein